MTGGLNLNGLARHVAVTTDNRRELVTTVDGKLIVATTAAERAELERLFGNATPLPDQWISVSTWLAARTVSRYANGQRLDLDDDLVNAARALADHLIEHGIPDGATHLVTNLTHALDRRTGQARQ